MGELDLSRRYARACDERDSVAFAWLFAPKGVLFSRTARYTGHAELARIPEMLRRYVHTQHVVLGVEVDGTRGESRSRAHHLSPSAAGGFDDLVLIVHYSDRYERVGGRWVIGEREFIVEHSETRRIAALADLEQE